MASNGWARRQLELCLRRGDAVIKVLAPGAGESEEYDRLSAAALRADIPF